ncbi:MAG: hypothetical protein LBD25_03120 [Coriobacteriales bacterium]|jgi:ech hydrogenase subunit A|nr:hypothetical protein [Coriobacteriales bacterium]
METIGFLIVFPIVAAAVLLLLRNERARSVVVVGSVLAVMAGAVVLAAGSLFEQPAFFKLPLPHLDEYISYVMLAVSLACCAYVVVKGVLHKRPAAVLMAVAQAGLLVYYEFFVAHGLTAASDFYVDNLSVVMALVVAVIGGGICIYALSYMRDFQKHEDEQGRPDRRPVFFALMFVFLSAMFVIVFSNVLAWLLCGWELTTVCSFALIGYTRTDEAVANSFRQIMMNLAGGLAFAVALILLGTAPQPLMELDQLVLLGSATGTGFFGAGYFGYLMLPIMLLAVAAFTKAAQMPFQSWLLGAMVAPTPTSALLHSSTMVKAGVFLLIKLAPCLGWNVNGSLVVLVGGLTFLFCSAIAVSQSNAKRVLAYSTVANLGLIVACAGIGTPEAVWAAVFLLVFHAAAKSLLFCCVGTAEHHIGSRDIEDMDAIFERMPRLALLMALGMLCMFIAPFGMLVSKWATIVSIVESYNIALMVMLAFGSAFTFMFWAKWLGKTLAIAHAGTNVEKGVHRFEWSMLALMAALVIGLSMGFPLVSELVVMPYLADVGAVTLGGTHPFWNAVQPAIAFDNLVIMALLVTALLVAFVVQVSRRGSRARAVGDSQSSASAPAGGAMTPEAGPESIYLSGVGLDFEKRSFRNALSQESQATQRNWYLESWFGESVLLSIANLVTIVVMAAGLVLAVLSWGGVL